MSCLSTQLNFYNDGSYKYTLKHGCIVNVHESLTCMLHECYVIRHHQMKVNNCVLMWLLSYSLCLKKICHGSMVNDMPQADLTQLCGSWPLLLLHTQLAWTKEQSSMVDDAGWIQGLFGPPVSPGHFIWASLSLQDFYLSHFGKYWHSLSSRPCAIDWSLSYTAGLHSIGVIN